MSKQSNVYVISNDKTNMCERCENWPNFWAIFWATLCLRKFCLAMTAAIIIIIIIVKQKYSTLSSEYRFEPIAVENHGVFSSKTLNFISEVGHQICVHTEDARETSYLFQRISIMLRRFNSVLLHDTLPVDLLDLWPSDILILAFLVFNPGDLYYLG